MATDESSAPVTSRQERRKAETRSRIVTAADQLFEEKGYAETSIEDIGEAADVAIRTIYLHFESKAAIMLSYFDRWLDAFITEVIARPIDEPVVDSIRSALDSMSTAGWTERVETPKGQRRHPLVEYLRSGSPDIAGHVMQRWVQTLSRLTADNADRIDPSNDPAGAHARAVAVFSLWMASVFAAGEDEDGPAATLIQLEERPGLAILKRMTDGSL